MAIKASAAPSSLHLSGWYSSDRRLYAFFTCSCVHEASVGDCRCLCQALNQTDELKLLLGGGGWEYHSWGKLRRLGGRRISPRSRTAYGPSAALFTTPLGCDAIFILDGSHHRRMHRKEPPLTVDLKVIRPSSQFVSAGTP